MEVFNLFSNHQLSFGFYIDMSNKDICFIPTFGKHVGIF